MNKLSMCETARPRRPTPQPHIADGARHPRVIWAVGESEGASQKPFDGDPYTRLARTRSGRAGHMGRRCVGFKAPRITRAGALAGVVTTEAIACLAAHKARAWPPPRKDGTRTALSA